MEIDGKKIAAGIIAELKNKPIPKKFLAAVVIGEDKASFGFLKKKEEIAKELGVDFRIYNLPADYNNDKAREEVLKIAKHKTCGGVLVQLPLPEHLNKHYVVNVIPREKDVDVLGERALGAFYNGRNLVLPPAVETVKRIILNSKFDILNSIVAIIGTGFLTGKPIAVWLMGRVRELYILDEGSDFSVLKNADLVISGVGKPGILKPEMLKEGAGMVDFGYGKRDANIQMHANDTNKKPSILGDLDTSDESELKKLAFYTPTPGGTGPILVAELFSNFYKLNAAD